MRTWTRCKDRQRCPGACAGEIAKGAPMLEIDGEAGTRVRCVQCALRMFGEAPPPELPELVIVPPKPVERPAFADVRSMSKAAVIDFRRRAAGDE